MPTQFNRPWLELKGEPSNLLKDLCTENEKGAYCLLSAKSPLTIRIGMSTH